jgi:hypothetical protein
MHRFNLLPSSEEGVISFDPRSQFSENRRRILSEPRGAGSDISNGAVFIEAKTKAPKSRQFLV